MQTEKKAPKERLDMKVFRQSPSYLNKRDKLLGGGKNLLLGVFRFIVIVGISYVILAPVIKIIADSFFSISEIVSPIESDI